MHHRLLPARPRAVAAGAVLALALSSCGFNYATDDVYLSAAGNDHRTGTFDVLNAVVVSGDADTGTFVATLANNSPSDAEALVGIGPDQADPSIEVKAFKPIKVAPQSLVSMADGELGIPVTGEFRAGDVVELVLDLENGEDISMEVPVVANDGVYADLDQTSDGRGAPEPAEPVEDEAH